MKRLFFLFLTGMFFISIPGQNIVVSTPDVSGPVTKPGTIFCASVIDLTPYGYVEEEYFIEGKALRYDFVNKPGTAIPVDTLYPYKTRIIVRRPTSPDKFNGTVVVEWLNVSSMYDVDSDWWQLYSHLMRSGYAWVGVSVQQAGIHSLSGLRKWNPARYKSLNVTADSTLLSDQLSFDIFSQSIMALKGNQKVKPLAKLKPEMIIATGHSQSAFWLTPYYNRIQPITGIIDGFMIRGSGWKLRTDIPAKVFKINSETDLIELNQVDSRQPDSDKIVTWEFSGTSHADKTFLDSYSALCKRDFGSFTPLQCEMPLCTEIPFYPKMSIRNNQ